MEKNKCRVFLGIPIEPALYEKLRRQLYSHHDELSEGRWILPENAHITIRFFGDIDRNQLSTLQLAIDEKIKSKFIHPFLMRIKKIAAFPNKEGSLIAAYMHKNDTLKEIFSLLSDISINTTTTNQPEFIPHITLYRNKGDKPVTLPVIVIRDCVFSIDTLVLYESQLDNEKRIYKKLYEIPLNKSTLPTERG